MSDESCKDVIDREYLIEHIEACWMNGRISKPDLNEVLSWINDVPSAQPKKGKWVDDMGKPMTRRYGATCTACGEWSEYITDYCPNCGAYMAEGEQDG